MLGSSPSFSANIRIIAASVFERSAMALAIASAPSPWNFSGSLPSPLIAEFGNISEKRSWGIVISKESEPENLRPIFVLTPGSSISKVVPSPRRETLDVSDHPESTRLRTAGGTTLRADAPARTFEEAMASDSRAPALASSARAALADATWASATARTSDASWSRSATACEPSAAASSPCLARASSMFRMSACFWRIFLPMPVASAIAFSKFRCSSSRFLAR